MTSGSIFRKLLGFSRQAFELPKEMPKDCQIKLLKSGGPDTYRFQIQLDSFYGSVSESGFQYNNDCGFRLTEPEMIRIYQTLREEEFDKIVMIEDVRPDFPTTSIQISWGDRYIIKEQTQLCRVERSSEGTFLSCLLVLENFAKTKVKAQEKKISFTVEKEVLEKYEVECYLNSSRDLPTFATGRGQTFPERRYRPGLYLLIVKLYGKAYSFIADESLEEILPVTDDKDTLVRLHMSGDKVCCRIELSREQV